MVEKGLLSAEFLSSSQNGLHTLLAAIGRLQEARAVQSALKKEIWSFRRRRRADARKELPTYKDPALAHKYRVLLGLDRKTGKSTSTAIRRALEDKVERDQGDDCIAEVSSSKWETSSSLLCH